MHERHAIVRLALTDLLARWVVEASLFGPLSRPPIYAEHMLQHMDDHTLDVVDSAPVLCQLPDDAQHAR